jgi:hypothetical protein
VLVGESNGVHIFISALVLNSILLVPIVVNLWLFEVASDGVHDKRYHSYPQNDEDYDHHYLHVSCIKTSVPSIYITTHPLININYQLKLEYRNFYWEVRTLALAKAFSFVFNFRL